MKEAYINNTTTSTNFGSINTTNNNDEYTFLCGYQKIRRYGSTGTELSSPGSSTSSNNFSTIYPIKIVQHTVQSTDTLQNLELKYNSSMYEIKRLNRLWSNDSLHCKSQLNIPIYDNSSNNINSSFSMPLTIQNVDANECLTKKRRKLSKTATSKRQQLPQVNEIDYGESPNQFFKRIDLNLKNSQKLVKKLEKK